MPYLPSHDELTDPAELDRFIARHPLATLISHDGTTPDADLIPLLVDRSTDGLALIGHVARANPLARPGRQAGPVLAVFGPVDHYVSPSWYPSKAEHHRVVPTWNYLVVHAWGRLELHDDPRWVRAAVARLTSAMERGRPEPWRMAMAPPDHLAAQLTEIVGVRIVVNRMIGRFKVSAGRSDADRLGARDGVAGDPASSPELGEAMTHPPQWRTQEEDRT